MVDAKCLFYLQSATFGGWKFYIDYPHFRQKFILNIMY